MTTKIKKLVSMLWVEVAFGADKEILYFEGTEELFKAKMQYDFIYFENYRRNVLTSKIKDFGKVDNDLIITREMRLSSLNSSKKEQVKENIKNMKKNIGREPTDKEFEKMVFKAVHGFLPEELEEKKRFENKLGEVGRKKTCEIIAKMRENKKKNGKYVI